MDIFDQANQKDRQRLIRLTKPLKDDLAEEIRREGRRIVRRGKTGWHCREQVEDHLNDCLYPFRENEDALVRCAAFFTYNREAFDLVTPYLNCREDCLTRDRELLGLMMRLHGERLWDVAMIQADWVCARLGLVYADQ